MKKFEIICKYPEDSALSQGEQHEYDIYVDDEGDDTIYYLHYSNSESWTDEYRGMNIMSIIDHGNGFTLNKKIEKDLEYTQGLQIMILFNFVNKYDNFFTGEVRLSTFLYNI